LYLSAALAFVGLGAARYLLPPESFKTSSVRKEPFDFSGAITFSLSISLLLLALATAQKATWRSPLVGIEFLGGIFVLGLFGWNVARVFRFSIWRSSESRHLRWETPPDGLALSP
jgi:hypothetical protein